MARKLKDEEISQLCMFLRLNELFEKDPEAVSSNKAFKERSEQFIVVMKNAWDSLDEDQKISVMEEYKRQTKILEKDDAPKNKRKK